MILKLLRALFSQPAPTKPRSTPSPLPRSSPRPRPQRTSNPKTTANREQQAPQRRSATPGLKQLSGPCYVIDGDTIVINKIHIRLFGIDAPEMDQPYGKKAKWALVALTKGQVVTANLFEDESYDRVVAHCVLEDGTDLSEELVKQGVALDWAKFSGGAYRDMETDDARKKLWRVAAKHKGKLRPGA